MELFFQAFAIAFTPLAICSIGLGALLLDGIGDTLRISLASDPVDEIKVGWDILRSL